VSDRPTIVVDDALGWATEAFAPLGRVVALAGTAIDRAALADADALVVRTVTRVDAALVAGTRVRFVGTATAGIDHVDVDALRAAGIRFASAAGSNAHAVVDYVVTALHLLALERDPSLLEGPCAIVGYGFVGRALALRLRALGMEVRVCDPPLARAVQSGALDRDDAWQRLAIDEPFFSLHDAMRGARIVTAHVPMSTSGADSTLRLIDRAALELLAPHAVVINTSRGGVVDEAALAAWLDRTGGRAVLDVWAREPEIDPSIVLHARVRLATPHIAGYSLEGKVAATAMIVRALADHLGASAVWTGAEQLGALAEIEVPPGGSPLSRTTATLRAINPIERDHAALRAVAQGPSPRAASFEALRRHYTWRRALSHFRMDASAPQQLAFAGVRPPQSDAIVLVAHGSPDPDWRTPLDAVVERVRAIAPHRTIALAFLDHLTPSLADAVAALELAGHDSIRVIAAFLSPGGNHIKRDIPALVQRVAAAHPGVRLTLVPGAIGAELDVVDAIAAAAARLSR
jgi:erythronate-4-phosphate dehydrogenase